MAPTTPAGFEMRLDRLHADLTDQGRRAAAIVERAVEAAFEGDPRKAEWVIEQDAEIDRVDVAIERSSVEVLADATREGAALNEVQLRRALTVVKVNNELERIADAAVSIAERSRGLAGGSAQAPETFRVMANSVVGMLESAVGAFARWDPGLARQALASDDAVAAFRRALLRDAQVRLASGRTTVDAAFTLHAMAADLERIADYCTNIAEQVIYVSTGSIVRHEGGRWSAPAPAPET